jgi:hypothetical protein
MHKLNKEKLRIGLLVDSYIIPAWTYLMLDRIRQSDYAEIDLVVLNTAQETKNDFFTRVKNNSDRLLYLAYRKLEDTFIRPHPYAFAKREATDLLAAVPVIKVKPARTSYSDYFEGKDILDIKKHKLDILVRLGFRILRGEVLETARFGIWSYHHGDNGVNRGGPAGFWEVFEGRAITGTTLQILTEDLDNGLVLSRSFSATDPFSVNRNRNSCYWKSLALLPRKLKELYELGEEKFFRNVRALNEHESFYSDRLYRAPKNREFVRLLIKHLIKHIKSRLYNLVFLEQWILMYSLNEGTSTSFWRFKKIIPKKDRSWADPHIVQDKENYHIFIEEYIHKEKKGHISLIEMDQKGNFTNPAMIIERPYHLSHPFVFLWRGEYYLIPEAASNRTIEVYKCLDPFDKWEFHRILLGDITAVDTTIFHYQQKWWMFTNVRENEGASNCDELFLFYADNPLSDNWIPHPKNPIVSDVRKSRPAGRIFQRNGKIYRPSQDCSNGYGYGIRINQIVVLNESEYLEREVNSIEPNWDRNITGVHTFGFARDLTLIDGRLRRIRFL